ncbi:MAG: hypothetical protein CVU06_03775 [Bacteroidetes bacterium HGW-Bacteroidetes-22]|nr:MAG: hypothetical protein CVU06_03775 [Bacteroidetes bacterium HGW-Bacteroidetes-22]
MAQPSSPHQHEIQILISLLDDPDEKVYAGVRDKLFLYGSEALPVLERAWESTLDEMALRRIENILQGIQKESLFAEMNTWVATGGSDLLQGGMLLSRFHYNGLDESDAIRQAGRLTQDLWLEMNPRHTPLEKIKVLNHVFFDVHGFTPVLNPAPPITELLIHEVLQRKKGNPVTLGIIYLMLAQSMHFPMLGVNISGHFAGAWLNKPIQSLTFPVSVQLVDFYVNAPIRGVVFTHADIDRFLDKHDIPPRPANYVPVSNVASVRLLADKLIQVYERSSDVERYEQLKIFLSAFE